MFSILPDLMPRDSHSLWYTSSRNPNYTSLPPFDPSSISDNVLTTTVPSANPTQNTPAPNATPTSRSSNALSAAAQIIERSPLGRLRAEELLMERRSAAVSNFGSTWLKPPGLSKTLFQIREEQREAEEHAEAMRREMLAQELVEAEAEAAAAAAAEAMGEGVGMEGEEDDMMMEGEEARDLDEDIPDADEGGFGYDGASDEEHEEEEDSDGEDEEEEEEEEDGEEHEMSHLQMQQSRRAQQRELATQTASIRATEDRMRQVMARGGSQSGHIDEDFYGAEEDIDEEEQGQMLDEDNLLSGDAHLEAEVEHSLDMDMDANLDDDIPEAELSGGYEHTDSEASLSSDGDGHNLSYARSSRMLHPRSSLRRSQGPRSSLDISGFLSRDGSSVMGSSPHIRSANHEN
ncbi:Apc15p protein-domain-containing protein [Achaetomium macrosporum]|uniref:Apc15p protein-domain-containing protein n=1 Tax=Achaetomium macrosporum TaxID=79813 RepID=A0AAN7CFV4_9PEZI|nr:Apc15p protein-domain-containing protein [Achaetomium macrosporum]